MKKGRLEAFSDGVLAIVITIMVLELKAPEDTTWRALFSVFPVFISYVLSFVYVAIYWLNHHNIVDRADTINWKVLWANLLLLFWLSLIPFTTSWIGENHIEPVPVALYGAVLLMCFIAFKILEEMVMRYNPKELPARETCLGYKREIVSLVMYVAALPLAFVHSHISLWLYAAVALLWAIPSLDKLKTETNKKKQ